MSAPAAPRGGRSCAYLDGPSRNAPRPTRTPGSRPADAAGRRRPVAPALHLPRRFAVVVRGALPAQAAGVVAVLFRTIAALDALLDREQPSRLVVAEGGPRPALARCRSSPRARCAIAARGRRVAGPAAASRARRLAAGRCCVPRRAPAATPPGRRPAIAPARSWPSFIAPSGGDAADGSAEHTSGRCSTGSRTPAAGRCSTSASGRAELPGAALVAPGGPAGARAATAPGRSKRFASLAACRPRGGLARAARAAARALGAATTFAPLRGSTAATAGRFRTSSPASRCCSGRGRRARWTRRARRSTRSGRGVALTYAEAGGWGRAIVLERRRRGIPTRRPAAWLHLPPLAELPARAGRDGCRDRQHPPIRFSASRR